MQDPAAVTAFLFTDIEGSTRLWEHEPARMREALARHDALARTSVEARGGVLVKTTGDGLHAAFGDPLAGVMAAVELLVQLDDARATGGLPLRVRCGVHAGVVERRDDDYFGSAVNRAARIMGAAHGGQVLVSQAVADLVAGRLPRETTLLDLGAVRLRDLAEPERIFQVVHPPLRATFPALRSLEAIPNNLPQQATSFIGRERELADVAARIRASRLVTVVGTGGLGKTRLSLQVAAGMLDDFADGVWLVDLASLTDPRLVAQAAASALGIVEEPGRSLVDTLVRHCAERALLLVLDNCEHLIAACADLAARLLRSTRGVKLLATSRERLNVRGEVVYPLAPLVVPDRRDAGTSTARSDADAVRLFVDRVMAVQPSFEATDRDVAHIGDICRRLDGIPLAIELAAARARALPIHDIAARLDDRFRLLAVGDRAALPRQQTLRALIDWSYDLLSSTEQALFARLSVFAGGFTLEAAEKVAADDALPEADVLDVLARLVEKSLVVLNVGGGRYHMLETVRAYAAARLEEVGATRAVRGRHMHHYVELAEAAAPAFFGSEQGEWLARIDSERENLLAAHAWCSEASDAVEAGLRLVALKFYWINRGLPGLAYRLGAEALARTRSGEASVLRCRALYDTGQIACYMGRYRDGQAYLEESLALARHLDDPERIGAALQPLAMACLGQGNVAAARRHLEEALDLARRLGSKHDLAAALNAMAQLHRMQDEVEKAVPLYEQVLDLARETGDRESLALGLLNLAMATIAREAGDCVPMLLEALAIADVIGSKPALLSVLEVSAGLAASRGDFARAARIYGAAEARAASTGLHRDPADEAFLRALMTRSANALGPAGYASAEAAGRSLDYEEAMREVRAWLAARVRQAEP
ncbi:MAG TPA: adenylate/guanylate cyclase domain-containing protein [Casimicrobiaceae bacterium]|nr:adenylate/guanylate cyclase domain-containing protein [Casimicrobiaceae bacterium]